MRSPKTQMIVTAMSFYLGLAGAGAGESERGAVGADRPTDAAHKDRARIVLAQQLPALEGARLKATLVEVNYGPGEASTPHSHPCPVIGYVVEGALRTQFKGEPEMTYKAGDSFYEPPNSIHVVSANASSTKPAKLIAYLLCDQETPLSVDVAESGAQGHSK